LKIPVVDADAIAHKVLEKGQPAYHRVVKEFRQFSEVVASDGSINRPYLRSLVFGQRELNRRLKKCTHQAIAWEMLSQVWWHSICKGEPMVVLDAPLLFESKANLLCKHVIIVHCSEATQLKRVSERDGVSIEEAQNAINAQMPTDKKISMSDVPIANDGTLEQLERKVEEGVGKLRAEAKGHVLRLVGL